MKMQLQNARILLGALAFVALTLESCAVSQGNEENSKKANVDTPNVNQDQKEMEYKDRFDTLLRLLDVASHYQGPFKKNPFLKDSEFTFGETILEISSYNSKFKIIDKEHPEGRIGQYDSVIEEVKPLLSALTSTDLTVENVHREDYLLRVEGRRIKKDVPNVDDFPLIDSNDVRPPKLSHTDKERLKELIFQIGPENGLYDFDPSYGTSSIFTPVLALYDTPEKVALIGLGVPKVKIYENDAIILEGDINTRSEEFQELVQIIKKYYPNFKY